ncbi:PSP1 C-terminal conserved region-domain-containing protein [Dendryphion nanum]|uniref:PSP1 C-terminal conserved region-domain-containing protein n=1 Tax=Dendryphion nanum TaxID=256645 RepID=A0A9P9EF30_9PLEO|nr:PSP1 C-terminal conserved region-domain-containing protein [Dendryphion nanum]
MSGLQYKGGLSAGGPSFSDKAKLQMRRPTPDSDAVASSDDEHATVLPRPAVYPAGRRPSSGWLHDIQPNRKFSLPSVSFSGSQPTTPSLELPGHNRASASAFPWNTNSFAAPAGTRLKEVVPSPTTTQPFAEKQPPIGEKPLPSPTHVEGEDAIGFLLNQNLPVRKQVRSQSYSVGQGDLEGGQYARLRSSLRHRPSKPSLLGDGLAQLSQLREDDIDEIESSNGSQQGVPLPADYWEREREAKQSLLKQAAVQNARSPYRTTASPSGRRKSTLPRSNTDFAIEEFDDHDHIMDAPLMSLTRRFSEHNAGNVAGDQLGRRHSFATYAGPTLQMSTLPGHDEVDEELVSPHAQPGRPEFDATAYFSGHGPAGRMVNASAISAAHPDPIVPHTGPAGNPYASAAVQGRPGRRMHVVVFKCNRADIYYTYDNTGLEIRRGDLVIVEGDRGCDLGQVTHADVTMEDAKKHKAEASDEHYRWLVMFSQYSLSGASNDNGMLGALARSNGFPNFNRSVLTNPGTVQDQESKPKMIKRLAQQHEISALRDKEGSEAKAKRLGASKAAEHKLPMEILDAEYQADYHKLTYFYYAEAYVNFNDLVTDLFKQYKVRIWMSAVNPASVVNPAGGPSAIGPGAIIHPRSSNPPSVGPGFGSSSYRGGHAGRGGTPNPGRGNYGGSGHFPFANQIPGYEYNRYASYQNARASPMNYGAYYPPGTYSSSPAGNAPSSSQGFSSEYANMYSAMQNLNFGNY